MKKDISAAGGITQSPSATCLSFAGKGTRFSVQAYRKRKAWALTSTSCKPLALIFPFSDYRQDAGALKPRSLSFLRNTRRNSKKNANSKFSLGVATFWNVGARSIGKYFHLPMLTPCCYKRQARSELILFSFPYVVEIKTQYYVITKGDKFETH